ncbi:VPLPA-CTERM sorting domain-containing protein [uncultured Roseobacter sp.]|uniref:VPLPA-CTERM sorting domain-containing protein n=1 Tax=uncultured Roseobacter sp. TaxID=114847 RepID=UPI00261BEDD1|nr:VPLPA-CTERM sorting domain-containing protein [uncultured Roseobacter sp.]
MYKSALATASAIFIASSVNAITYNVDFTAGDISVGGFITTDGTLGAVDGVDEFLDFRLNVSVPGFDFTFVGPNYDFVRGTGSPWILTEDKLVFDFSASAPGFIGGFRNDDDTEAIYFCIDGLCSFDTGVLTGILVNVPGTTLSEFELSGSFVVAKVPEVPLPATLPLLIAGLGGLVLVSRRARV